MSDKQTDAPQKQVHWANDYGIGNGVFWYSTRAEADAGAIGSGPRIAVIRREWVEGQLPQYFTEDGK